MSVRNLDKLFKPRSVALIGGDTERGPVVDQIANSVRYDRGC
jgi:hypothetical protein